MLEWVLIGMLLLFVLLLSLAYFGLKKNYDTLNERFVVLTGRYAELTGELESRAREIFETWRASELETRTQEKAEVLFRDWKLRAEKAIRQDAIRKSEAVIGGKVTEHLLPFFPAFRYNPKDARFLGTPVDLIVFDGLSEGAVRAVAFVEVKTGKTAGLSARERQVRNCIEQKRVTYEVIRHEGPGKS